MSDYNSSLPVRTEAAGDLAVKIVDSTITSQQLTVNADGSVNVVATATNLDIRDLTHVSDSVSVGDGTDLLAINTDGSVNITDNGGSLTVDGTVELGSTTLAALESITVQNGAGGSAVNIQDGGNSITVDGTVELGATTLAALESITVTATALDIRALTPATDSVKISDGTDSLAVNTDGSINVVVTSSVVGTPVCDYNTASAVAAGASSNHDYTVTAATTLKLTGVLASASGKCKITVQVETGVATGVFNTKFVAFNSTATPNMTVFPTGDLMVAAGVRVRIIRTNKDNQSQDLYSTIEGSEV